MARAMVFDTEIVVESSMMNSAERELVTEISEPDDAVVEALAAGAGDLLLLGAGGKIGHGLALMAKRALETIGATRRVIAISRFGDLGIHQQFEQDGIDTIACDLSSDEALEQLPDGADVVYLAGQKFGTSAGNEATTWLMNAYMPGLVAQRWPNARFAVFSSGNVYRFTPTESDGAAVDGALAPIGEYAQSVLGRERIFEYFSCANGTKTTLIRLNYVNEPRYGVLVDIGAAVLAGNAVDLTMGSANVIWAGDCNRVTLCCLSLANSPPTILNLAGPKIAVRDVAERFGRCFGVTPRFTGTPAPTALLSDGSRCWRTFGPLRVSVEQIIDRIAGWLKAGHPTWNKPTHFEIRDGKF